MIGGAIERQFCVIVSDRTQTAQSIQTERGEELMVTAHRTDLHHEGNAEGRFVRTVWVTKWEGGEPVWHRTHN